MACLQISRSGLLPALPLRSAPPRRCRCRLSALRCRLKDPAGNSSGEEPPESLFMKELKRRGMTPTSSREDSGRGLYEKEMGAEEEGGGSKSKRNGVASAEYDEGILNQRERSLALNSEGLEGLIPRAKMLLTIGGTFFLGFWPLILITTMIFAAMYLLFGSAFVHDGSDMPVSPPPYIDPYALLEDERMSQTVPYTN